MSIWVLRYYFSAFSKSSILPFIVGHTFVEGERKALDIRGITPQFSKDKTHAEKGKDLHVHVRRCYAFATPT